MERALYFTKFRNLGFEHSERLVLNYSLEKGKMGNLVIIVGANNSGKSNVLDGLTTFAAKNITDRDITTLSYEEEYLFSVLMFFNGLSTNKLTKSLWE